MILVDLHKFTREFQDGAGAPLGNDNAAKDGSTGKVSKEAVNKTIKEAQEAGPVIQSKAESLASKYADSQVTPINYKSEESMTRKVNDEYGGDITKLHDAARTTIIVPDNASMEDVFAEIGRDPNFTKVKWQRPDDYGGYSGIVTNYKTPDGTIGEIQVNTPKMIYAKNDVKSGKAILGEKKWNAINKQTGIEGGLGHGYYEKIRTLPANSPEKANLLKEQEAYYKNFLG